jgi:hypothetical protein
MVDLVDIADHFQRADEGRRASDVTEEDVTRLDLRSISCAFAVPRDLELRVFTSLAPGLKREEVDVEGHGPHPARDLRRARLRHRRCGPRGVQTRLARAQPTALDDALDPKRCSVIVDRDEAEPECGVGRTMPIERNAKNVATATSRKAGVSTRSCAIASVIRTRHYRRAKGAPRSPTRPAANHPLDSPA